MLKITPATIGRVSTRRIFDVAPPSSTSNRASHSGIAKRSSGGTMNAISRCWTMWTE